MDLGNAGVHQGEIYWWNHTIKWIFRSIWWIQGDLTAQSRWIRQESWNVGDTMGNRTNLRWNIQG